MKIALCQFNPVVGDCLGNAERIINMVRSCQSGSVDLFVFPELSLVGYPPRDLLSTKALNSVLVEALEKIKSFSCEVSGSALCIGAPTVHDQRPGRGLYNSAIVYENGRQVFVVHKTLLPTYDVFDETRYFDTAPTVSCFEFRGEKVGITICEDAWNPSDTHNPLYEKNPVDILKAQGATLLVNMSASPFYAGKQSIRAELMRKHACSTGVPFVFVNQVGGNDDLIFDGSSLALDKNGMVIAHAEPFVEEVVVVDTQTTGTISLSSLHLDTLESVYRALCLGLADYCKKCGFTKVLVGLSGGIDSAVVCALAAKALGPHNVVGITMPSRYSSQGSVDDSKTLADNLGVTLLTIPIEPMHEVLSKTMQPVFTESGSNLAQENMQARIRGTILMAYSNKYGHLLLSTGNKSEVAVGYCTLYGDMNGGLSVIADLPKMQVYELAAYINRTKEIIPKNTISKPPSAELRPDQKDQDTLPPYPILDAILELLIEDGLTSSEIIARGFNADVVEFIVRCVKIAEYKRRQAAFGLKVTSKAFGMGRRFPIAAKYTL